MPIYHRIVRAMFAVLLVLVAASTLAFAEGTKQVQLDLATAIKMAVENKVNLGPAEAGLVEALARVEKAEAGRLPTASVSSNYTRLQEPIPNIDWGTGQILPGSPDVYSTSLSVQWPLYTGGKISAGLNMAELGADSAQLDYDRTYADLVYQAVQGYISLLKAQSFVTLSSEFVSTTQEHLKFVETNYELGYVTKSDLLETGVRLGQAQQALLQAQHGARLAEESLKNLLGLEVSDELILTGLPEGVTAEEVPTVTEAIQAALQNRSELRGLRIAKLIAEENLVLAKAYWKPTVAAVGTYSSQGETFDPSWQLTLSAQLQLFDGGAGAAGVDEAKAGVAKTESSLIQAENGISLEVRQKYSALTEAVQSRQLAALTSSQAKENHEFIKAKYELGAATNLEVLTALSTLNQAKNSEINAEYDYHLAILNLYKAMGQVEKYNSGVDVHA